MSAKTKLNGSSEVLHLAVAQRLRALIVEGGIAPGQKLNERELAERLQVSRTPLREALKLLTAEGLVERLPNRGAIAVQLSSRRRGARLRSDGSTGRPVRRTRLRADQR